MYDSFIATTEFTFFLQIRLETYQKLLIYLVKFTEMVEGNRVLLSFVPQLVKDTQELFEPTRGDNLDEVDFRASLKIAFNRRLSHVLNSVNLYLICAALHPVAGTLLCISNDLRTEV
jgi:hypothetical protein